MDPLLRSAVALASFVGVLAAAAPGRAHGAAVSRFVVSIGEQELAVRANLHLESVLELVEGSHDLAHAGDVQAAIARHRERVLSYLRERLEFRAGGALCEPGEPRAYGIAEGMLYVRVDLAYDCLKSTSGLSVTSTLFAESGEAHHIEGEFHAAALRRVYQLSEVRSSVAIDPSSFRDKPYRGQHVPALEQRADTPSAADVPAPAPGDALGDAREPEREAERADRNESPNRDDAEPRELITHAGWYVAALALVLAVWHLQRTLRRDRSRQRERVRRKGRRIGVAPPAPPSPDDSNQAVSG